MGFLKDKTIIGFAILILVIVTQFFYAKSINTELSALTEKHKKVEANYENIQKSVIEQKDKIRSIESANTQIRIGILQNKKAIRGWLEMKPDAIKNPEMDEKLINKYFNGVFGDFSCMTGGECE